MLRFSLINWIELTKEEILDPDLPICDPHHHLWDKRTDRAPYHRYLLDELLEDTGSGHNVLSTVFVEAESMFRASGPDEFRAVGEVEFVQGTAAASASGIYGDIRAVAGIVGSANLNLGGANWYDLYCCCSTSVYRISMIVSGNKLGYMVEYHDPTDAN